MKFTSFPHVWVAFGIAALFACNETSDTNAKQSPPGIGSAPQAPLVEDDREKLQAWLDRGEAMVQVAFDSLRTRLSAAIAKGGAPYAVAYCQVSADDILASARSGREDIRRTSLKYRNPDNAANEQERMVLKGMQKEILAGREASAQLLVQNGQAHYYQPILVQALCLNCHGHVESDISAETLERIDSLYPEDRARGYAVGDLRGMWHIAFNEAFE